jgi:hypothetical protein
VRIDIFQTALVGRPHRCILNIARFRMLAMLPSPFLLHRFKPSGAKMEQKIKKKKMEHISDVFHFI